MILRCGRFTGSFRNPKAAEVGCLRVIDESGEDYLYPTSHFVQVMFPADVQEQLLATVGKKPA